eukprot:g10919.t2
MTAGGAGGHAKSDGTSRSHVPHSGITGGTSSRSRNGTASEPALVSVRTGTGGSGSFKEAPVRSGRQRATASRGASLEVPETPTPRMTIAGAAAMVAGGRSVRDEEVTRIAHETVPRDKGRAGGRDGDISPRTAKKVLPHFLAIGNPGSQALVPKEGAEIVQKQHAKWEEYEARQTEERKRLRDYLAAVKEQAESQKAARADKKSGEFMEDNPDPGRAYPCRFEYDIVKEQAWRKAWCEDLEKQIELKRRLERGIRHAEASRDRVRAAQLDAAVKADRRREMKVMRLDKERINK